MLPLNTSSSPTDVDNEATAELPVLDIVAYESSLNESVSSTDTWAVPHGSGTPAAAPPAASPQADATVQMPPVKTEAIPTRRSAEIETVAEPDRSGTHEMPAQPKFAKPAESSAMAATQSMPATRAFATPPATRAPPPVTLPPSPPLIEEFRHALATAERRIEELNERARIADAERIVAIARANAETAQLREQLGLHLEALQTAKERLGAQRADEPELEDQLFARGDRIVELEKELSARSRVLEEKLSALTALQRRSDTLDCDGMNLRAAVARRDSQIAVLESDLQARQHRDSLLSARLSDALSATDPHVPELRSEIATRAQEIHTLKAQLRAAAALASDKDHDLQVAEECIRNLEVEVRDKAGKLEEASATVEEWRAVIAESQRSILQRDSRIHQLETDLEKRVAPAVEGGSIAGEEIALEGPARVLIRTDGNTDFVHVLGRRTRIGRGNDNELVLDTKHISRYHAVLLAGPVHTSIEDLNSTNGVFVNGKRVARQVLKDGDRITIGRTQFRYTVRS